MGRGIDITLGLKDNLSGALRGATQSATGQLNSLQKKMDSMRGPNLAASGGRSSGGGDAGGANLFASMVGANLVGSALSTIAGGILSAGQSLIGAISDQFKEAEEANRGALGATSANAALLGISFRESGKLTQTIAATLAESANKLPGATKDYLQAFNGVSDTLVLSGGMTKKGLTDAGREMVELTALLGQASGAGSGTTSTVLGKMLGDTGSEALFRIDAFEKVPAFKALLEKDLEKAGKTLKDFFKMDAKAKQDQLVGVKKQLFSKEYIAEMNLSMGAQLDTLKSKLTDPTAGLFGFMRNVRFEGGETNVLTELGKTFSVIMAAASEVVGGLGFSFDPMLALVKGLRGLTDFVRNPGEALPGIVSGLMGGLGSFATMLITLPGNLISGLGSMLMSLAGDGAQVQLIAAQISAGVVGWISQMIRGLSNQSGSNLEGALGVIVGGFALIGNVALGVIYGIAFEIPGLLGVIGDSLVNSTLAIGVVVSGLWDVAMATLADLAGQMVAAVNVFFGAIGEAITGSIASVGEGFQSILGSVASNIGDLVSKIPDYLASVGSAIMGIGPAIAAYISSSLSNLVGGGGGGKVGSKYSGQNLHLTTQNSFTGGRGNMNRVLTASSGLYEAAQLESQRMPSGSSLVIANSSELIIPRNQIDKVLSGSGTSVNITINPRHDRIIQDTVAALTEALNRPSLSMV
jgi:hypothetical protein